MDVMDNNCVAMAFIDASLSAGFNEVSVDYTDLEAQRLRWQRTYTTITWQIPKGLLVLSMESARDLAESALARMLHNREVILQPATVLELRHKAGLVMDMYDSLGQVKELLL